MLFEEGFTQNRELSWLRYNERVLEEALDERVPLFERLRFIAIFDSNLEDFFKVRVGSLLWDDHEGRTGVDEKSGMTASQQLRLIHETVPGLLIKKDIAYSTAEAKLAEAGVTRLEAHQLDDEERGRCFDFFRNEIKEHITVKVLDASEDMPVIDEDRPCIICALDAELEDKFGFIDIPGNLPKVFVLPYKAEPGSGNEGMCLRYMLTSDIIKMFADTLFIPFLPLETYMIDIARNAGTDDRRISANTAVEMRKVVKRSKEAPADKLIADGNPGRGLRDYLIRTLGLDPRQIFTTTQIDLSYLDELSGLIPDQLKERIMYGQHVPYDQTQNIKGNIIDAVQKRDILSAYPYDSMDVFLSLLRDASFSTEVREIRITIYRLSSNPKIAEYLIYAARSGKKVKVILELRARFDEERNLEWADRLRAAGCRVYYGTDKYKVHSKMCQIVLEEKHEDSIRKRYITQISTGNYNEKTAKQYTDLSIITYDQKIGKAASKLFRDICREKIQADGKKLKDTDRYAPLAVSPVSMRSTLLRLIRRETKKSKDGLIFFKVNAVTDEEIMEALMNASCSGCRVRMIVRGICCLLPGVEGCTENICTVSLTGRFLEHSRVYVFGEGDDEIMYISSADLMTRNMDRRVEVALPVKDSKIKDRIRGIMNLNYNDSVKGRVMLPDGTYVPKLSDRSINSQEQLAGS